MNPNDAYFTTHHYQTERIDLHCEDNILMKEIQANVRNQLNKPERPVLIVFSDDQNLSVMLDPDQKVLFETITNDAVVNTAEKRKRRDYVLDVIWKNGGITNECFRPSQCMFVMCKTKLFIGIDYNPDGSISEKTFLKRLRKNACWQDVDNEEEFKSVFDSIKTAFFGEDYEEEGLLSYDDEEF